MSADLHSLLAGERVKDAPRPTPGDVVTRLRCECGTVVALLARSGGETWLWRAAYRHTPRGAAEVVMDAALDDFEALARLASEHPDTDDASLSAQVQAIGEFSGAGDIDKLAAAVPPLRMPARMRRITGIAQEVAALNATRRIHTAPVRLAYMEAGCTSCRSVLDVQEAVVMAEPMPQPPRWVVVEDSPALGVEGMGYGWPESARLSRVALYKTLSGVLP